MRSASRLFRVRRQQGDAVRVSPVSAVAAGVITACTGGVIQDITVGMPSIRAQGAADMDVTTEDFQKSWAVVLTVGLTHLWKVTNGWTSIESMQSRERKSTARLLCLAA